MKRLVQFSVMFWFTAVLSGQAVVDDLIALYQQGAFEKAIELGDQSSQLLDRDGWYILGLSYYENAQEWDAVRCFSRSLELDPHFSDGHYQLGNLYFYQRDLDAALYHLKKAYRLQPFQVEYASFLAEVFTFQGMLDSAILYGAKAIELPGCPASVFSLLGQLHYQRGNVEAALSTYEKSLKVLEPLDESFWDALYMIAQIHYLEGNFAEAEKYLKDFLETKKEDYHALCKLIQVHYAQGEFDQGRALKPILYRAYQQGKLPPDIRSDGFCFDQFRFEEQKILAFEQFQEVESVYTKHVFYVTNAAGEVECTLETECNQYVRGMQKKFVLVESRNGEKNYYYQYLFDSKPDYEMLKKAIFRILKGKEKPKARP